MKILMLTHEFPPFLGGIGTYASQLAIAAHEIGHEITVMAPDFGQDCTEHDSKYYPFTVVRFRGGVYNVKLLLQLLWRIWRQVRRNKYDLIHAVDWPHILGLAFLNKIKTIPFVATVYGTELLCMPTSRHARWLNISNFFEMPERIFAISLFTKSLYCQKYPTVKPDRVKLTYLGVNKKWFQPIACPQNIHKKYGIPLGQKIILTVARLDERKGHRTVLKALALLDRELKDSIIYVIVGTGGNPDYIEELNKLASLSGTEVLFVGGISTSDLHALYASSSLFCMPGEPHAQKVEGFGLVYLEAAAQGLPSIGSHLGAVPEVVLNGKTGIIVEPLDVKNVAKAIEQLLKDNALRKTYGISAQNYAKQFTWQRCAKITYGEN